MTLMLRKTAQLPVELFLLGPTKKPISQRRHHCNEHGLDVDRDFFPAFLERHVVIGNSGQSLDTRSRRCQDRALRERRLGLGYV